MRMFILPIEYTSTISPGMFCHFNFITIISFFVYRYQYDCTADCIEAFNMILGENPDKLSDTENELLSLKNHDLPPWLVTQPHTASLK